MLGVGLDWAEDHHDVALGLPGKGVIEQFRIDHDPDGVARLVARVAEIDLRDVVRRVVAYLACDVEREPKRPRAANVYQATFDGLTVPEDGNGRPGVDTPLGISRGRPASELEHGNLVRVVRPFLAVHAHREAGRIQVQHFDRHPLAVLQEQRRRLLSR